MDGVVLAYRPDVSIIPNVEALAEQVGRVYVVNNSPGELDDEVLRAFLDDPRIALLDQGGNVGVAAGFNAGIRAALDDGAEFVWIFDQDSTVSPGMLSAVVDVYLSHPGRTGIVAPALRSHATGVVYRREQGAGSGEVDTLISSGSLLSRDLIERIGMHDEALFIDYVDHDISLRARAAGLHNIKVYDVLLEHRFGDSDPVRFAGRNIYLSHYSPLRQYYMARNRMILLRRYGIGRWFWSDLWFTAKAWVKVLMFERDRRAKIGAFFRGWRDGVRFPRR